MFHISYKEHEKETAQMHTEKNDERQAVKPACLSLKKPEKMYNIYEINYILYICGQY